MKEKKYEELKGVSFRLNDHSYSAFKMLMESLKKKHGRAFSVADLVESIISAPRNDVDSIIETFLRSRVSNTAVIEQMANISDDAKARIAAILAEEAKGNA